MAVLTLAVALSGCQTSMKPTLSYPELLAGSLEAEAFDVQALRRAFFAEPDFNERLTRLTELENQAMQLVDDEPLKLGSLGSAILDTYYGSLAGHYVSMKFYEHVENDSARLRHEQWVNRIKDSLTTSADGSIDRPIPAVTPIEPVAWARSSGMVPVGSIYRSTPGDDFVLLIQARPEGEAALENLHFELNGVYSAITTEATGATAAQGNAADPGPSDETDGRPFSPFALMAYLARQGDSAAQASIGAYLATHDRRDDAIDWLEAASRSGNVLANNLLARVYFERAEETDDEALRNADMQNVLDNYVHAVALGSLDSAYALGVLYLSNQYGPDNAASGVPLLRQAVAGGHPGAALFLGHLHYQGREVPQDNAQAAGYFVQAAADNSPAAQIAYARFLLDRRHDIESDPRTLDWLEALAERESTEAMVLAGSLHARGLGTRQSARRAQRWFERAVDEAEGDPGIINEVAWVLTVSDQPGLKRADYALALMDQLMSEDSEAKDTPAYLDTWAAALAANGQFEQAVRVQKQALERARPMNDPALIEELEGHLARFEAGESLTEPAP